MAIDCSEGLYTLKFTDLNKNPLSVNKKTLDQNAVDIALLGRARQEYGDYFDENLLHILENFACEEDENNPGNPDLTGTYANLLSKPIEGQKWYNKTTQKMCVYDGSAWIEMGTIDDVGGNSGIIAHGMAIPLPISPSGYQFSYEECAWIVNLFNTPDQVDYTLCSSDGLGVVTAQYKVVGDTELTNGYAFYQIIGIRGVKGTDDTVHPTPTPTPTLSVTPSVTQSRAATPTPTPAVTNTRTPVASVTPTRTLASPTPTPTKTISHTPTKSRTPTPTPTKTISHTPTPSASIAIQGCGPCYTNCPLTTALLPDGRTAGEVKVGDTLLLADEKTLENYTGVVSYSQKAIEASVKVTTISGAELSCTKSAPLATDNGFVYAADVMGLNLAVMIDGKSYFDEVISVEDIGDQEVQHITVDNKAFWVGDTSDKYVLHHNMKWCCDARGNCESMPPSECGCYVC